MITIRTIYFFIFVGLFLVSTLGTAAYFYLRYRHRQKYPYGKWEDLFSRLGALDHDSIALIARDSQLGTDERDSEEGPLDARQVWNLLGGTQGLRAIEKNCAVLVDLAFYVQQWYPEALLIAEDLRLNAREVQWHLDRLRGAAGNDRLARATLEYLKEAIAIYFTMTNQVLSLYERGNLPELADLQTALT